MKIVADERITAIDSTFACHGELVSMPGREIQACHLKDADALITRTVTPVNRELLEGSAVRFVGTATIGTDHIDSNYLNQAGIHWTAAPGCNADATAQYTLAIWLLACQRLQIDPTSQKFGVVGCGNVGGRLIKLLNTLNVDVIGCDPPLEAQGIKGFCSMDEILECDVTSLHVPLTRSGQWPTWQMFKQETFTRLAKDTLLINACRGDVIEMESLKRWLNQGGQVALDVWPGEPNIDPLLIQQATVASPHVAGYSLEGKLRATTMVYQAFCNHFGISNVADIAPSAGETLDVTTLPRTSLENIILAVSTIERDDQAIRDRLGRHDVDRIAEYDALRSHYPGRREFAAWQLQGALPHDQIDTLEKLGFSFTNR